MRTVHPDPVTQRRVVPDSDLVVRLLQEQAPHLAGLPVRPSQATASSNWVFRLVEALAVRLPRSDDHVHDLLKEMRWLPPRAPAVPVPVPEVEVVGEVSDAFPRPWAVVSWVSGDAPGDLDSTQQATLAETLGPFMQSLHRADASGMPAAAERWGYRSGDPVTDTVDRWADTAARSLSDLFDPSRVRQAWRLAIAADVGVQLPPQRP